MDENPYIFLRNNLARISIGYGIVELGVTDILSLNTDLCKGLHCKTQHYKSYDLFHERLFLYYRAKVVKNESPSQKA